MDRHEVVVHNLEFPMRVSDVSHILLPEIGSKSQAKKQLKKKHLLLNGETALSGDWVKNGDTLTYLNKTRTKPNPKIELAVAYEDSDVAIVVKPFGLPTSGNRLRQLDNALPHILAPSTRSDALVNPQPIHRLDSATYGLLIVAKTKQALQSLNQQLLNSEIEKYYEAIVIGKVEKEHEIKTPIKGQTAHTMVRPISCFPSKRFEWISHIGLQPVTGRTHQLRIHLSEFGHPIMGDRIYCPDNILVKGKGMYLAALRFVFNHPVSGKQKSIDIEAPKKFKKIILSA
jgi:23S rRNA pseudouridine1911/1915/1917 synthase